MEISTDHSKNNGPRVWWRDFDGGRWCSPRLFVFFVLTLLRLSAAGEGNHSPTVSSLGTKSDTHRVPDPMNAKHAAGVSNMKESLRGWAKTSNNFHGGSRYSGISSGTGDDRYRPLFFHRGVFQRGGAWFTGYSDSTEGESDQEEEEEEQENETSEEQGVETLGEGVAEGDRESGCAIAGETVEASRTGSMFEDGNVMGEGDDEEVFHGEGEVSTSGFGWGAEGPSSSVDIEEKTRALEGGENSEPTEDYDGGKEDNDEGGDGDEENEDYDEREAAEASGRFTDVYTRTVARRRAFSSTLRVFQKACLRTAILLAAFQMLPWLRHNIVAQWLLLGSVFLQTVNEFVAVMNAFNGDGRRNSFGDTDRDEEASADAGMGRFSPRSPVSSTGMFGGLMRAISPEHDRKQHFDFERLNDYFDKDSEALATAGRSKADIAALLASGAAEDTRMLGASVLRAMKGLTGSYHNEETRSSGGGVKKGDGDIKRKTKNKMGKAKRDSLDSALTAAASSIDTSNNSGGRDSSSDYDGYGNNATKKRIFVVKVGSPGTGGKQDNSEMELLSGAISFLIAKGNSTTDEVVVCLESGGGEVSEFGLGASKLARLREKGFYLTICVDKVAASGGYMMACVANRLIAAPFAMLGSIGVVGGIPNFNKALKKAGIEYFHFTAGQHKSLVGPFQEVTRANQLMQQRQIDGVHSAFKRHVRRYRPAVDVEMIGTGEVWLGLDAIKHCLVDQLGTTMEYLESRMVDSQVFLMKPHMPRSVRGSSLLRLLLLGPLASMASMGSKRSLLSVASGLFQEFQRFDRRGRFPSYGHPLTPRWRGDGMIPTSNTKEASGCTKSCCDTSGALFPPDVAGFDESKDIFGGYQRGEGQWREEASNFAPNGRGENLGGSCSEPIIFPF